MVKKKPIHLYPFEPTESTDKWMMLRKKKKKHLPPSKPVTPAIYNSYTHSSLHSHKDLNF